jgi:rubrerythrin
MSNSQTLAKNPDGAPDGAIETMALFLAHAHALELEAAEQYSTIGDSMNTHNNPEVAEVFRKLGEGGQKHAQHILDIAGTMELPHVAPWDSPWGDGSSPEMASLEGTHYLMTPYHAFKLAHAAESSARNFYADVAEKSPNPDIQRLAKQFAEEEAEHVKMIDALITKYPEPEEGWDEDPDPPNMPE